MSPEPVRCERASSMTTRAGATGAVLAAALDTAGDAVLEGAGEAGAVEADAAPLDVPAIGVLDDGAAEDAASADVDVPVCLELEVHAVATIASVTSAAACMYLRDDVSTGLLK